MRRQINYRGKNVFNKREEFCFHSIKLGQLKSLDIIRLNGVWETTKRLTCYFEMLFNKSILHHFGVESDEFDRKDATNNAPTEVSICFP